MSNIVTATVFKATCLDLLDQVSTGAVATVTITKRGRIVGVLHPPEPAIEPRSLFGSMRGSVVALDDTDLTEPVAPEMDAASGILHR